LARHGLKVPLDSYREQAHERKTARLLELLREGRSVGLVSDAGTPAVSDPGSRLVAAVAQEEPTARIVPVSGASAVTALVSVCGFGGDGFDFRGFPPHKKGRTAFVARALESEYVTVMYESPHRIRKLLQGIRDAAPERQLCIGRELTKIHETIYRGTAEEIRRQLDETSAKGEFAVAIDRKK
jgi:16S rRNA (cytidine1402-2'-O)-methyltransferase